MAERDHQRKGYEARTREASQAIPRSMETILGGWRSSAHRAGIDAKLEADEGVTL